MIRTERLVLRKARVDDAAVYRELWTERDPRVPPHRRIDADGHPTVEDIAARIRAEQDVPGLGLLTVTLLDGEVIGYCGLLTSGRGSVEEPELAYELLRRAHGHGYATEAGAAVVAWAADAGHRRLLAGVRTWNTASRNVLRKLGFTDTGTVEPDPGFGDSVITSLTLPRP